MNAVRTVIAVAGPQLFYYGIGCLALALPTRNWPMIPFLALLAVLSLRGKEDPRHLRIMSLALLYFIVTLFVTLFVAG